MWLDGRKVSLAARISNETGCCTEQEESDALHVRLGIVDKTNLKQRTFN